MCEFKDAFHEELPRLPPQKEIDFDIQLTPRFQPISKALYCITPTKLKKLKIQLENLLHKGFIRPDISPWDAPVLLVKNKDRTLWCVSIVGN